MSTTLYIYLLIELFASGSKGEKIKLTNGIIFPEENAKYFIHMETIPLIYKEKFKLNEKKLQEEINLAFNFDSACKTCTTTQGTTLCSQTTKNCPNHQKSLIEDLLNTMRHV